MTGQSRSCSPIVQFGESEENESRIRDTERDKIEASEREKTGKRAKEDEKWTGEREEKVKKGSQPGT